MKKLLSLLLVSVIVVLSFSACTTTESTDNGKLNIVATIFPQYDFARQIVGDKANLRMLLAPAGESHTYEPSPQDIIAIEEADVFLYIGGESEEWVNGILNSVDTQKTKIVRLMDSVHTFEEETVEGMEHDEEENEKEIDEHIWTSPQNAIAMVKAISEAVCEADKENAEIYRSHTEQYIGQLQTLDKNFKDVVDGAKRQELVFGDRFPLRYFTEEYHLTYYAAFPGCSAETEPSASTIAFLTDKVKKDNIPIVLKIELSNGTVAQTIAKETNTKVMTFYSCHNLSKEQFDKGETYLSMMTQNVSTLQKALN